MKAITAKSNPGQGAPDPSRSREHNVGKPGPRNMRILFFRTWGGQVVVARPYLSSPQSFLPIVVFTFSWAGHSN